MDWRQRITFKPDVCHGKACVKGTRIPVTVILDNLANGIEIKEILKSYPAITEKDILACFAYASELTQEQTVQI